MKRRISYPLIAAIVAPIALSASPVFASGDDSDDATESTVITSPSIPRAGSRDRSRPTLPPVSVAPVSAAPAPSNPPVPSVPSTPSSTPGSVAGDSKRAEIVQKLNGALTRIQAAPVADAVKQPIVAAVQNLLSRVSSGSVVTRDELERLASDIERAVRGASAPKTSNAPSVPGASVSVPRSDDDDSDDDSTGDDASDDDSDNAVTGGAIVVKIGDDFQFDPSRVRRNGEKLLGDLAANITRAVTALTALPQGDARDAALAALAALQTRVDSGETIPPADVLAVFRQVAEVVHERIGGERPDDEVVPERGGVTDAQKIQRMLGVVTEALAQLDGRTGADVDAAVAALQALKATLDAGQLPDHDAFENAIDLARTALGDSPAVRAAMTLSGVIAAVQASSMPADVKAHLVEVLQAARTEVLTNPSADVAAVVRTALEEVRAARIAGAIQHMLAIADRLEALATEVGNNDALALITEARAILQPADGSTPTRDDMHRARHILVSVVRLLRPSIQPSPSTTSPETTVPESSTMAPVPTTTA